jgi:ribonuclease HII
VIGTDEAGYGPNLGPLAIGLTAWRVEAAPEEAETALAAALEAAGSVAGGRLWGDSKLIYRGGAGLDLLERGVLVALALASGGRPARWAELAAAVGINGGVALAEQAALDALGLPRHGSAADIPALAELVRGRLAALGVAAVAVRCRLVTPGEFNGLLDRGLNKSDILSAATLELAAAVAAAANAAEPVVLWCDRHGGRRRYAPQVARAFATPLIQPLEETAQRSRYRIGPAWSIEFTVGGEARLPVAVASMTAKYLRELAMLAFNAHWGAVQPGLGPTAGYPVDATRWRQEAAAAVGRAGIAWDSVWRRA